jgi:hypothetical protein
MGHCARRVALASLLIAVTIGNAARADEPAPRYTPRQLKAGKDMIDRLALPAVLESAWSFTLNLGTELTSRGWDAPYPWGILGQYTTRILYGTTWTVMVGIEAVALILAHGGEFDWLAGATYRTEWLFAADAPACPQPGAYGGCGVGLGGFSFAQIRPRGGKLWYESGGGWIQQRILNDQLRTVNESAWVLTPLTVLRPFATDRSRDLALRVRAGAGLFFGMHAAHMHPTELGAETYQHRPWSEIYPLAAGIGPGPRLEGRLTVLRHLTLDGDLVVAPFLAGGPSSDVSHDVAPLDAPRHGLTVWRRVEAGIGWTDPGVVPFDIVVALFGAELSERSPFKIGYRGAMLRFDVPLRLAED